MVVDLMPPLFRSGWKVVARRGLACQGVHPLHGRRHGHGYGHGHGIPHRMFMPMFGDYMIMIHLKKSRECTPIFAMLRSPSSQDPSDEPTARI
eukprot:3651314-Prymnesium_polylepis.1